MKLKKGDKVTCFGYGSYTTHYHNGCRATVERVETEPGCMNKMKNQEITIAVVFQDFPGLGVEYFHPKQLVLFNGRKKK